MNFVDNNNYVIKANFDVTPSLYSGKNSNCANIGPRCVQIVIEFTRLGI
jgi:hypothetical protein